MDPWGPERRLWLGPAWAAFGWGPAQEPHKPMPGTPNFVGFDHFLHWKSIFVIFAYQGSVKCHFDPILTPFEPLRASKFWPSPNVCLFRPTARMDLWRDLEGTPKLTQNWTSFGPLEGPERRLQLGSVSELPLGWRTCSEPQTQLPGTPKFWSFRPLFPLKSQFVICLLGSVKPIWPHFDPFEPSPIQTLALAKCAYLGPLPGWTFE